MDEEALGSPLLGPTGYESSSRRSLWDWLNGPPVPSDDPPRVTNTLLVPLELFPSQLKMRFPYRIRVLFLCAYMVVWFMMNYAIMYPHLIRGPHLDDERIVTLSCTGDGYFWRGKNEACGLLGRDCVPERGEEVIIKCPALCDRGWSYAARPVGTEMVKYRQYVIGGGESSEEAPLTNPYRGDSYPCSSAVHGGVLSPFSGGCVKIKFTGVGLSFESRKGPHGTNWSVGFPSFFPSSFVFEPLNESISGCHDPRFIILILNILLGAPVMYLAGGLVGYWTSLVAGFWTILLVLDPPFIVNSDEDTAQLISNGFAKFLPLCFVLHVLWTAGCKRTLTEGSPLAKLLLWYPLFWVGSANVITFDRIPIDRMRIDDIKQMPGSVMAIIVVIPLIIACVALQAFQIWKAGKLIKYAKAYVTIIVGLAVLSTLPNLGLRIHHYMIGMLLVPGTGTRGITAYPLQGLLLGLLLSGVARWDFASVVETEVSLLRGEAGTSSAPPPGFQFNGTHVLWDVPEHPPSNLPGYSLMVNDVELWVGEDTSFNVERFLKHADVVFFRVALSALHGDDRGDYTRAATIINGTWIPPEDGVS